MPYTWKLSAEDIAEAKLRAFCGEPTKLIAKRFGVASNSIRYHLSPRTKNAAREWNRRHYTTARRRRLALKFLYGLSPEEYQLLLDRQNGLCAICGKTDLVGWALAVDHAHGSRTVRGLLCMNCNQGVGKFQDDPELLRKAARYIEGSKSE